MLVKCVQIVFLLTLCGTVCKADVRSHKFEDTKLYAFSTGVDSAVEELGVVTVAHNRDVGYYITIFADDKPYNVQLDLGSALTWITSLNCESKCEEFCKIATLCAMSCHGTCCDPVNSNPNYACLGKNAFTPGTTFKDNCPGSDWIITNGEQHTVNGTCGTVNFSFGSNPTTAVAAKFGLANTLSLSFTQWNADGVLGLAKKAETDNGIQSIIKSLPTPFFQLALIQYSNNEAICGKIAFGSESLAGYCNAAESVKFDTITTENTWQFNVTNFELTGNTPQLGVWRVALDINSPFITLQADLFKQLTDTLGSTYDDNTGSHVVDCNKKIELKLSPNGRHYLLMNQNVLITKPDANKKCHLQVQPKFKFDSSSADIIFGTPVFASYCQTFKPADGTITFYELTKS